MTLKMKNISFITGMVFLFLILWGAGSLAAGPDGFSGFGQSTDISPDDSELVFSYFHGDDAALYAVPVSGGKAELLAKPEEGKSYHNPKFSPDGESIAFIEQWESEERQYSQLRIFDRNSQTVKQRINTSGYVTEGAFSPDGKSLYFLKADVYKNYSPIASERPHDFDIFRMDLESGKTERITDQKAYDMSSLEVTSSGDKLMYKTYQSNDQLVFLSLKDNSKERMVPVGDFASGTPVISSPTLSPDGKSIVFSDVAAKDENGTFVYEAFRMDLETKQAEQLTNFHEHVTSPVYFHNADKLIVTINKNFAGADPEYSYWAISADGERQDRLEIKMPEADRS
ncbi:TolB protein [Lentibacillus persicus]|uniref:TolB protein n=1 Tax=Lentibacillus persicus TaxID=640948 RepID=A0A1I1YER4_9BACI|nr:PD40 domain-containing protein [Lentibacillus persicus]SFE18085.1 TolB protein [Lentibacillus persicus]